MKKTIIDGFTRVMRSTVSIQPSKVMSLNMDHMEVPRQWKLAATSPSQA